MTWQHLQHLRGAARGRIQRGLEGLRPQGGAGVVVSGNVISISGPQRSRQGPEDNVPPETLIYATLTERIESDWEEITWTGERTLPPEAVLRFDRQGEIQIIERVPGQAQDIGVGYDPGRAFWDYWSEFEVKFESRTGWPGAAYEKRSFREPVLLEVETFYVQSYEDGPQNERVVVNRQSVLVGPEGAKVKVVPTVRGPENRLEIVGAKVEREG